MKIIKKFDQYIKENLENDLDFQNNQISPSEEVEDTETSEFDNLYGDDIDTNPEGDIDLDNDINMDINNDLVGDNLGDEGELDDHEYIGTRLMADLAERLGATVNNNTISYDNKVINYYSETESFHVGDEEFSTVDEVFDYLTGDVEDSDEY